MLDRYDSIIIGAGHNGLVCSAYLAKAGQRVLVLEASEAPGGLGARREFHPGFHVPVAHTVSHFSQQIVSDLKLAAHGCESNPTSLPTIGLSADQAHVVVHGDSVSGAGEADAQAYAALHHRLHRFAKALSPFWSKTMPRIGLNSLSEVVTFGHMGLNIRRLGKKDMREFMRVATLPARDLVDECFENELLKAVVSWDGMTGSKLAPRSPNGAVLAMLYRMSGASRGAHAATPGGLIESLHAAATGLGAEVRCSTEVRRVLIEGNADGLVTRGVELADGVTIESERVISAIDPQRTFLDLVGVEFLDIGFTNRIRRLRCDGYVAKLHLALSGMPEFPGLEAPDGRMIIAPDLDAIEFAFDDAKYGACPENPVMEVVVPSVHDATLAPTGQHVLSAHVMYVPNRLKGGWTDAAREALCQRAIDTLARYAPGIREQIIHRELMTPADLEREYRVTGGHWHHTEFAFDQLLMMRPTYDAAQYATPVPGLFLCGAGSHPGGDLTGAPGYNAAREILQ